MVARATPAERRASVKNMKKEWHRMSCFTQHVLQNLQSKGPDEGSDWGDAYYTKPELKGALPDLHPKHCGFATHTILL